MAYSIIRLYQNGRRQVVKRGLTEALAKEHCSNPETSSSTCTTAEGKRRTRRNGPWFEGFTDEPNPKGRRRQF